MTETTAEGLSVVIICRDEAGYIEDCLCALESAAGPGDPPLELIVVDGRSTDDTIACVQRWATRSRLGSATRVVSAEPGYGRQRNAGALAATHPWVAFLSADVRVPPRWLQETAACLKEPVDLAIGRFDLVSPPGHLAWMAPLVRTVYPSCSGNPWVEQASTVHLVVRRAALLEHRFDERLLACEDKDLAFRLQAAPAWRGAVRLPARPRHLARESIGRFLRKLRRESQALALLARRHGPSFPDCFGWRRHSTGALALLTATLVAMTAWLAGPGPSWMAWLAPAAWLLGANIHVAGWKRRPARGASAVLVACLHLVAMLCVTLGYVSGWWCTPRRSQHV